MKKLKDFTIDNAEYLAKLVGGKLISYHSSENSIKLKFYFHPNRSKLNLTIYENGYIAKYCSCDDKNCDNFEDLNNTELINYLQQEGFRLGSK